ncbi:hypothetical protein [Candidatus Skiveiella danica]|uniref:hypothetical protein n=1 Tax=Candidatus Skiveiella danica TaxID=3386177 RepID=UPI0039B828B6
MNELEGNMPAFPKGQSVFYTGNGPWFHGAGHVVSSQPDRCDVVSVRWAIRRDQDSPKRGKASIYSLCPAPPVFVEWLKTIPKGLHELNWSALQDALDDVSLAMEEGSIWTGNGCIFETLRAFSASPYRRPSKTVERWLAAQPDREPDYPEWLLPKGWKPPPQVTSSLDHQ